MKTVIVAGGAGTRLAEETRIKPKPMVEIGGRPIRWYILRLYASHGFNEFGKGDNDGSTARTQNSGAA